MAFVQAPYHLFPLLLVALPILVYILDGAVSTDPKRPLASFWPGFVTGWWFGFGYFLNGLWWVGSAFLVEVDQFGWALPFSVILLPAGLALFWGLGLGLARCAWSDHSLRLVALVGGLVGAEWLRSYLFTGFPWNHIGLAAAPHPIGLQSASVIGVDGLALIALWIGLAPVIFIDRAGDRSGNAAGRGHKPVRMGRWYLTVALALFVLHIGFGVARLSLSSVASFDGIQLRIVQPNIPQDEKWAPDKRSANFNTLLELSDRVASPEDPGLKGVTHLIWPETAFPFFLTDQPGAVAALAALLPDNTILIAGAVRTDPTAPVNENRYFNSVYAIDGDGEILAAYDKVHLVPFGEYLPFQTFLESIGLEQLTRLKGGFEPGPGYRAIDTLSATPPFLPLICYEILFVHEARAASRKASWIINVTNDAWFGDTPGPRQHLHASQLSAVTEGLSVVRAANTGISAVIDPYGRVIDRLKLGESNILDTPLPLPLEEPPFASKLTLFFGIGVSVALVAIAFLRRRKS